ncbi:MAG: cellulase family glycosylhydrolase [Thermoguttaceae bacterium]
MTKRSRLLSLALLLILPAAGNAQAPAASQAGLAVAPDGRLLKDGRPYRGVGANYFDLLVRLLNDPDDTSSLEGLEQLGKAAIPFVRFAVAYDERQWKLFFDDRAEFFRRFDLVVRVTEKHRVGLVPSFFWSFTSFPDMSNESRDQWGNPESQTIVRMREIVGATVDRYRDSPALWAWEFGNEPNLAVDLPNAAQFRKKGGTERDDYTSASMVVMLAEFAREVRRHDDRRPIIAGHSHPRPSAWHNTAEKSWKADSREQTLEIIRRDNPSPLDTVAIHLYGAADQAKELSGWATGHADYLEAVRGMARELKRPVFVGEFGLADSEDQAATRAGFENLLAAMEAAEVDLAAFWVFDLSSQNKTWNVTFANERAYMLELAAEANRRWNQAALGGSPPLETVGQKRDNGPAAGPAGRP